MLCRDHNCLQKCVPSVTVTNGPVNWTHYQGQGQGPSEPLKSKVQSVLIEYFVPCGIFFFCINLHLKKNNVLK